MWARSEGLEEKSLLVLAKSLPGLSCHPNRYSSERSWPRLNIPFVFAIGSLPRLLSQNILKVPLPRSPGGGAAILDRSPVATLETSAGYGTIPPPSLGPDLPPPSSHWLLLAVYQLVTNFFPFLHMLAWKLQIPFQSRLWISRLRLLQILCIFKQPPKAHRIIKEGPPVCSSYRGILTLSPPMPFTSSPL